MFTHSAWNEEFAEISLVKFWVPPEINRLFMMSYVYENVNQTHFCLSFVFFGIKNGTNGSRKRQEKREAKDLLREDFLKTNRLEILFFTGGCK